MIWREKILREVLSQIPKVESVLDIGAGQREVEKILSPNRYVSVDIPTYGDSDTPNHPDIEADLNRIERLPFLEGEFQLVVLSHILEHLNPDAMDRIISESCKVSSRYILVGLPNDLFWLQRLRVLLGHNIIGVTRYGHHYMFDPDEAEKLLVKFHGFKVAKRMYVGKVLPPHLKPKLTAYECYYLLERNL